MPTTRSQRAGLKIIGDEILPRRRSSLQVNVSYASNLTDSGNESFHSAVPDMNASARKGSAGSRNALTTIMETPNCSSAREHEDLALVKERETALNESCQRLRDAIMNKTQELFHLQAELIAKTSTILGGPREALKEITKPPNTLENAIESTPFRCPKEVSEPEMENRPSDKIGRVNAKRYHKESTSELPRRKRSRVMAGSNEPSNTKALKHRKKLPTVRLTRLEDAKNENLLDSSQTSIRDIGAPITCSSFISRHGNSDPECSQQAGKNNQNPSGTNVGTGALMPNELISIQNLLRSTGKGVSTYLKKCPDNRSSHEAVPMELTDVQIPATEPRETLSSDKSVRTSLNVNTSICRLSETSINENSRPENIERNDLNEETAAQISMRVNTSLGSNDNPINTESTEDHSRKSNRQSAKNDKGNTKNWNKISDTPRQSSVSNRSLRSRFVGDDPSFIEATPQPPCRSVLWRTYVRNNNGTLKPSVHPNSPSTSNSASKVCDGNAWNSVECVTAREKTILVDDSPCRIVCNTADPRIIDDSSVSGDEGKRSTQKVRKRKLMPLADIHEVVSFSPVSHVESPPKEPKTWEPRKCYRKRKSIRAAAEKRLADSRQSQPNDSEEDENKSIAAPASSRNLRSQKTQESKKPEKKRRKVLSKKITIKKKVDYDLMHRMEATNQSNFERSVSRDTNSANVFSQKKICKVRLSTGRQKICIVATGFSRGDIDLVKSIIKELGGAELSSKVSRRTTHVVNTGARTINLLRGIIAGCWMVSMEWVLHSFEEKKWLNPEKYEMAHYSKAVQENRRDREIFGKSYVPELFTTCGRIYIAHKTSPPPEILKELIKAAGGQIAEYPEDSRLSIGTDIREAWVLDSITTGELQPIAEYKKKKSET